MTKKARRRARRAAQQAGWSVDTPDASDETLDETPASAPAEPAEPVLRDAVTGEQLSAAQLRHALVMVVRDRDTRIDRDLLGYVTGVSLAPDTLHTRQQDGAVGKRYSHPFARYLAPVLPQGVEQERREWHQWWTIPYVVERLQAQMEPERFAVAMARLASKLPLAEVEAGRFEYRAVLAGHSIVYSLRRHSRAWVLACEREAMHLVRSHYLPRRAAYRPRAEERNA